MDRGKKNDGSGPGNERPLRRRRMFKRLVIRDLRNAAKESCVAYMSGRATQEFMDYARNFHQQGVSEADRFEEIAQVIYADSPMTCDKCGGIEFDRKPGARFGRCVDGRCGKVKWVTAGSFFSHLKSATLAVAMFGLFEAGIIFNPHQFAIAFNCSYDSASGLFTKIQHAVAKEASKEIAIELINSRAFKDIMTRRSWQTPAECSADSEQESAEAEVAKQQQAHAKNHEKTESAKPLPNLNADELKVMAEIQKYESPVPFDKLLALCDLSVSKLINILTILELEAFICAVPGGRYALLKSEAAFNALRYHGDKSTGVPRQFSANDDLAAIGGLTPLYLQRLADVYVLLISLVHQGVSRKKLHIYVASYMHILGVRKSGRALNMYKICLRSDWGTRADLRALKCPLKLNIFAPTAS